MRNLKRKTALAAAAVCFLVAVTGAADAAGAFAVGACGAYGYGFDFRKVDDARIAAMKKCTGRDCHVVGVPARDAGAGLYLGPLRAARPRRVGAVVTAAGDEAAENTERVLQALRTLRHGPWWPPLDELLDHARHFFAGSLGESTLSGE